jgi:hypothetical protein
MPGKRLSGVAVVVLALAGGVATALAVAGPHVTPSATVLTAANSGGGVSFKLRAGFRLPKHAACTGKLSLSAQLPGHAVVTQSSTLRVSHGKCTALFKLHLIGATLGQKIPFKLKYNGTGGFHLSSGGSVVIALGNGETSTTPTGTGTTDLSGQYGGQLTSTAGVYTATSPVGITVGNDAGSWVASQSPAAALQVDCGDGIYRNPQSSEDMSLLIHLNPNPGGATFSGSDSQGSFTVTEGGNSNINGTTTPGTITVFMSYHTAGLTCTGTGTGTISK